MSDDELGSGGGDIRPNPSTPASDAARIERRVRSTLRRLAAVDIARDASATDGDKGCDRAIAPAWTDAHVEAFGARPSARSVRRWRKLQAAGALSDVRPYGDGGRDAAAAGKDAEKAAPAAKQPIWLIGGMQLRFLGTDASGRLIFRIVDGDGAAPGPSDADPDATRKG